MALCTVILAGGGGTRLWPLSRELFPKQFLNLFGKHSMLQNTLLRLDGLEKYVDLIDPLVVCNEEHRFLVSQHADVLNIKLHSIILEPEGRNTAPAMTICAIKLLEDNNDPILVMMPADHLINDSSQFQQAIYEAYQLAEDGMLVTFGVKPHRPETGYGYIKYGEKLKSTSEADLHYVAGFNEKPELKLAKQYISDGHYLWNSGIFMMRASIWLNEIEKLQPKIYQACQAAYSKGITDNEFYRLDQKEFTACPSDSIDYAIMEKIADENRHDLVVVSLDAGWSDIGSWSSVWDNGNRDSDDNVFEGDVIHENTTNSLIRAEDKLVVTLGCDKIVVIETADVVLVANKDKAQDVKNIVEKLKTENRNERILHRRVYRPWGSYKTIDTGNQYQVKRLTINPEKKISLQLHHKRSEHWVVVKGTATITRGDEILTLGENESTYIPAEMKHRIENKTDLPATPHID